MMTITIKSTRTIIVVEAVIIMIIIIIIITVMIIMGHKSTATWKVCRK